MADVEDTAEPDARTLADLSALADGTLDPDRVPSIERLIADSPSLRRRYDRERSAVAAMHALRADRAPARLRMSTAQAARPSRGPRARPRLIYGGALPVGVAAAVAALLLLLPGGGAGALSVSQAAAVALRGPILAAPTPDPTQPGAKLRQDVEDVYFPNWSGRFGWRAVGQRVDRLDHRVAVTVYYQRGSRRIAYTILASPALKWPGNHTRWVKGVRIESLTSRGRLIVTWRRAGHTCILSGADASVAELAKLAAWQMPDLK
jgi:hypothetical protein